MPTYANVPINSELEALQKEIEKAKKENTYDAAAATWDQKVLASIKKNYDLAQSFVAKSNEFSQNLYEEMKLAIKQIETLVAKKTPDARDAEIVGALKAKIEKAYTDADLDSKALTKVLATEYRGGWPALARKLLKDPAPLTPFVDGRKKEIDEGKMFAAYRARLKEWTVRAAEYFKQVTQRSKQGAVEVVEFQNDMKDFLSKMTTSKGAIEVTAGKVASPMEKVEKIGKLKVISAQDKKNAADFMTTALSTMKNLRGAMKTMTVEYDGLKKRASMSGPGWKEQALKAVKSGKDLFDAASKICAAADKREKDCVKINEKVQKTK